MNIKVIAILVLCVLGFVSGGFERLVPDFLRLVDGPLPSAASVFRSAFSDWGAICALAFLEQFAKLCFGRSGTSHGGFALASNVAVAALLLILSWCSANWITLGVLLAAVPGGFWTLVITALWLLAPTFMAIREGSVQMRAPYPFRSLARPARFSSHVVFRGFLIACYGILAVLLYEALLQLLPLLEKYVAGLGHQAEEQH